MKTRVDYAIEMLKSIKTCPLCGADVIATFDQELKNSNHKDRFKYRPYFLKQVYECGADLFVDKTGHLANDTPCDLVMMEKATFIDFDLSEKISQERRTGHANKA